MKELRTTIEINAPANKIWDILMDFDKYPEWNPFIISLIGKPKLRDRLKITLQQQPGSKPMVFKPRVTMHKTNERFAWLGQLWMTGIFDGHHIFEIEEKEPGKCLFIQREEFNGLLVSLLWKDLNTKTRAGFEAMNKKIKELAEL